MDEIKKLIEYADLIFSNRAEAELLSRFLNYHKHNNKSIQLADLSNFLSKLPKKNPNKKRVVIITDGNNPASVSEYDSLNRKITSKTCSP